MLNNWRYALSGFLLAGGAAFENAHDVGLLHDEEILAIDLHFGARPLAEQDEVAGLHFRLYALAVLVERAGADRDHFALLGLFLRGVGNDDAARGLLVFLDAADDHAVAKRTEFHWGKPPQEGQRKQVVG